jgi:hypothetical protein
MRYRRRTLCARGSAPRERSEAIPTTVWIVAGVIALVNLPFGYWRAGVRKFSPAWFVAVHAPVPIAVGLRFAVGLGFRLATLPIFIAAYFAGQLFGARFRRSPAPPLAPAADVVRDPADL